MTKILFPIKSILITNQAGQRTGLLVDGKMVEEIPGSWVAEDDGAKYVVYPADTNTTTRLQGTGDGFVTFSMVLNKEGVVEIAYSNIAVTTKTLAIVRSSDTANMEIDSDGDGTFETKVRADFINQIHSSVGGKPTSQLNFKVAVSVAVVGMILVLLLYARRKNRKKIF